MKVDHDTKPPKVSRHQVRMVRMAALVVVVVILGLFLAVALLAAQLDPCQAVEESVAIRIVPWTPGNAEEPSPYLCFAAMGGSELLALDCLDTSLIPALVGLQLGISRVRSHTTVSAASTSGNRFSSTARKRQN